eukprot:jgi/Botrbrau1/11232/Bobra.0038s0004.1
MKELEIAWHAECDQQACSLTCCSGGVVTSDVKLHKTYTSSDNQYFVEHSLPSCSFQTPKTLLRIKKPSFAMKESH